MEAGTRCRIYARVSTAEQGESRLGLEAQLAACRGEAERRGWLVVSEHSEVVSGGARRRPVLDEVIDSSAAGDVILVAKPDRLSRSLSAYVRLIERAQRRGYAITAADGSLDLTTPQGRAMAAMAQVFAQLERELIGERTRAALAAKRARGERLGPVTLVPDEVRDVIVRARRAGGTYRTIAAALNEKGVPGPTGGVWYPMAVRRQARIAEEAAALS